MEWKLITRDGMEGNYFHNKCDNQGPTISLFKNEKGYIFGGYASTDWTSSNSFKSASDSFIFSLTNIHGTEPTKFPNSNTSYSIYDVSNYGPTFGSGHDICIYKNDTYANFPNSPTFGGGHDIKIYKNDTYANFPNSYQDILSKGKSIFTGDSDNNNKNFKLKEIEVFKVFK